MKLSHSDNRLEKTVKFCSTFASLLIAVFLFHLTACSQREESPAILERQGWVSDYAGALSQQEGDRISANLESFEKNTCHQIFLLIIPTLAGQDIVGFSQRTASAWKIGQPGFDNGFLVTVAIEEGTVRIETGSAFESFITGGIADKTLKEVMFPLFRQDKLVEGLELGLEEIMKAAMQKVIPEDHRPDVCRK